jgi:hypothetical protein
MEASAGPGKQNAFFILNSRLRLAAEETGSEAADDEAGATCGGMSFTASAKVLLASGAAIPISQLKTGMRVLATNTKTGKTQAETVTAVLVHQDQCWAVGLGGADTPAGAARAVAALRSTAASLAGAKTRPLSLQPYVSRLFTCTSGLATTCGRDSFRIRVCV